MVSDGGFSTVERNEKEESNVGEVLASDKWSNNREKDVYGHPIKYYTENQGNSSSLYKGLRESMLI